MLNAEQIDSLLSGRAAARARKDFAEADRIRELLRCNGVTVVDTQSGQRANAGKEFDRQVFVGQESSARARVEYLEHSVTVLLKREHAYSDRISELVKENLSLKYGETEVGDENLRKQTVRKGVRAAD